MFILKDAFILFEASKKDAKELRVKFKPPHYMNEKNKKIFCLSKQVLLFELDLLNAVNVLKKHSLCIFFFFNYKAFVLISVSGGIGGKIPRMKL